MKFYPFHPSLVLLMPADLRKTGLVFITEQNKTRDFMVHATLNSAHLSLYGNGPHKYELHTHAHEMFKLPFWTGKAADFFLMSKHKVHEKC